LILCSKIGFYIDISSQRNEGNDDFFVQNYPRELSRDLAIF